ncbi:uncharacterized protein LOC125652844 [Ostrea edulis]|uniref:uncharacterized protein LOC125652844 n=1 Tax=Ostrea edulis TaxID=37623 RepID=UPI0024AEBE8E|nr:uncharacterized protein LOC125652844 [Ostrea edulis]
MDKLVWFVCLSIKLCSSQINKGCCGRDDNGLCRKCCSNHHMIQGTCEVCSPGFYGKKCRTVCTYPKYGELCRLNCSSCNEENCNPAFGCPTHKEILMTSPPAQKENTSWLINTSTKNNRHDTTKFEKKYTKGLAYWSTRVVSRQLYIVRKTKQSTSIYTTFHPTEKSPGGVSTLTNNPWLIYVVGFLGIFLGVSVVVIFGLSCLLSWNKRMLVDHVDELVTISRCGRSTVQGTNMYSFAGAPPSKDQTNTAERISITDSADYQSLCGVSHLRDSDEKGRSGVATNSTNTYIEPETHKKITKKTSIGDSSYVEMIP